MNELTATDHSSRAHALLSASGTYRWWHCAGSILASEGIEETSTEWAREGTAAHEIAQDCLLNGRDAIEWIDRTIDGFTVDDENWAEPIQVYLDECRGYMGPGWQWWVERKISLEKLGLPTRLVGGTRVPVEMFGTADFVAYSAELGLLVVVDLKFGKGVPVAVDGNPQIKYYALGALLDLPEGMSVQAIRGVIVQPRVPWGNPVKPVEIDPLELMTWSIELMERAQTALEPKQVLMAGSWCRFCPLTGRCVEQANASLRVAQDEFDVVDLEHAPPTLPDPRLLTSAQLGAILDRALMFEEFIKAVREVAKDGIHRGWLTIPGWTITPRQAREKWASADDAAIARKLIQAFGVPEEKVWTRKLASPAQTREAIKAGLRADGMKAKDAEELARSLLTGPEPGAGMVVKESSGVNLVPAAAGRPVAGVRGSEFDLLDAPESSKLKD